LLLLEAAAGVVPGLSFPPLLPPWWPWLWVWLRPWQSPPFSLSVCASLVPARMSMQTLEVRRKKNCWEMFV
jgi:hypothetical protein